MNKRIDDAARGAGREPTAIHRALNIGDAPVQLLVSLTVEHGMDTYMVRADDPVAMRRFAVEVAPKVREGVAKAR